MLSSPSCFQKTAKGWYLKKSIEGGCRHLFLVKENLAASCPVPPNPSGPLAWLKENAQHLPATASSLCCCESLMLGRMLTRPRLFSASPLSSLQLYHSIAFWSWEGGSAGSLILGAGWEGRGASVSTHPSTSTPGPLWQLHILALGLTFSHGGSNSPEEQMGTTFLGKTYPFRGRGRSSRVLNPWVVLERPGTQGVFPALERGPSLYHCGAIRWRVLWGGLRRRLPLLVLMGS